MNLDVGMKGRIMEEGTPSRFLVFRHALKAFPLLLLVSMLGACDQKQSAQSTQSLAASSGPAAPRNGRYVITVNPNARVDTFLLDTQSGRVWRQVKYTDVKGEPTVWEDMTIIDNGPPDSKIPGALTIFEFVQTHSVGADDKGKK